MDMWRVMVPILTGAGAVAGANPAVAVEAAAEAPAMAGTVVRFWAEAGPHGWFGKDPAFDRRFRERFAEDYRAAADGRLDHWAATPEGALALLILLDQYPRNSFRGTPAMYATDAKAVALARAAVEAGHHERVERALRSFFVLPFAHSEWLPDQEQSVRLARALGEPDWGNAERHRGIIYRFGRFPHRNAILGRESTAEERAYLANGGYRG
jgi:uncharacterized protein (DUF924 family)